MEGTENTYIYIVFSNTPCKMGSFIRAMTHGAFNHVSVALDGNLSEMYSFARLKRDTPFCGGFVREGVERYRNGERTAEIAVCGVNVGKEGAAKVRGRIELMNGNPDVYLYNMLSAMLVPWHKCVSVRDSFTCVEFAAAILKLAGVTLPGKYYSAAELYTLLRDFEIYKGEFPQTAFVADDGYDSRVPIPQRMTCSVKQLWRLIYRFFSH